MTYYIHPSPHMDSSRELCHFLWLLELAEVIQFKV